MFSEYFNFNVAYYLGWHYIPLDMSQISINYKRKTMKQSNYIYLLLFGLFLLAGCRQDEITMTNEDEILPETENVTFQILITDEQGDPVDNAQVDINAELYYSDENGVVITKPQKVSALGTRSEIIASGYESLVKLLNGPGNSVKQEKVILFKAAYTTISTGTSGTIDAGGKLTLPESLIDENGTTYSGEVTVKNKYLDPDNKDFLRSAPGDLLALNTSNEYQQLASFGMYMVELYDADGALLNIPEGSTATIEFPIAEKHQDEIGTSIPLWYFDEENGVWKEEGEAQVVGETMVAEVTHFTWWNCDLPYDFTTICLLFLDSDGEPMPGMEIEFSVNGASFGLATTDAFGTLIAKVPVGEIIDVKYFLDGIEIGTQSIGPFGQNARKETINTDLNPTKIFGVAVDCDSNPVTDGYGYYQTNSGLTMITFLTDGSFAYYAPGIAHELVLVDVISDKIKTVDILDSDQLEDLDLGLVVVCEEDNGTKISGSVLIDTDEDNIADSPLPFATLSYFIAVDNVYEEFNADENGYYELDALPGRTYRLSFLNNLEEYRIISVGDYTPDGDNGDDEVQDGGRFIYAMALPEEHDADNDFWALPSGEGTISGSAMADTNGDGLADAPMEWASVTFDVRPGGTNKDILVDADGNFSSASDAANYLLFMNFDLFTYPFLKNWDTTPDPDGEHDVSHGDHFLNVILYDGEEDSDNEFVCDNSLKRTFLCRVMEDINSDGIGDVPLESLSIKRVDRLSGGSAQYRDTDQFGVARFFDSGIPTTEFTVSIFSSGYEVIDIIDTTPDNNPLIIDGDLTKMEIDLLEGEWDAGSTFVVRKI